MEAQNARTVVDRAGHASKWHIAAVTHLVKEVRKLDIVLRISDADRADYQDKYAGLKQQNDQLEANLTAMSEQYAALKGDYDKLYIAANTPADPPPAAPPVDNEHVAEGCERFTLAKEQVYSEDKKPEDESA